MLVKDLMTKEIVCASTEDTVFQVAKMMKIHNIGCVPVVANDEKVLGVVTDRDIVLSIAKNNVNTGKTLASSIMSEKVYSVRPGADVEDALQLMKLQKIRRLPVIENDRIMGMISFGDVAASNDFRAQIGDTISEISSPARPKNL